MTVPVYYVFIDWECPDFAGPHDFSQEIDDITADVKHFRISRGKDKDSNTYPAATLELVIENSSGKYYPTATTGDLVGLVRLWLPVKVIAMFDEVLYPLYYGYINRITAYPIRDRQDIYFYCTDGIDLLSKTIVVQDMDDKTVMTDGDAVHRVLNAANWKVVTACTMQNVGNSVTAAGHGLENDDPVMFTGASIPAAINDYTIYYVTGKTDDLFSVSATLGGLPIDFLADGSGFFIKMPRRAVDMDGGDITYFPETFEYEKP